MATNDFLPFANDAATANVVSQSAYAAAATGSGYVQNGFVAGTASSQAVNKALRQGTVMASALGGWIVSLTGLNVTDSGGAGAVTAITGQISLAIKATVQAGAANYAPDTGTVNAVVAALSPAPAALTVGMAVRIKAAITNTGAVTLNLNAFGAQPVVDEEGNALVAGQIVANSILTYTWDGASWRVSKPKASSIGAGGSSGQVQFNLGGVISGAANLYWDSASGRVGIGVNTPASKLHIRGDGSTGWSNCGVQFENTGVSGRIFAASSREGGKFSISDETTHTERLSIDPSGRFALGIATALAKLHIYASDWPLLALENPANHASLALKGNAAQSCIIHYGDAAGGNELRFGRYDASFANWQANPVRIDMDAPDGSFLVHNNGDATFGFALTAQTLHGVGAIPVGGSCDWYTETPPTGFLECNGAAISRTTYASLFAVIGVMHGVGDGTTTFNLPDLRGYFRRVWDHGVGRDPDRASRSARGDGTAGDHVGTTQSDQIGSHTHTYTTYSGLVGGGTGSGVWYFTSSTNTGATGGSETRAKNVNVMVIMRAY